jgi:hypothetical protein
MLVFTRTVFEPIGQSLPMSGWLKWIAQSETTPVLFPLKLRRGRLP